MTESNRLSKTVLKELTKFIALFTAESYFDYLVEHNVTQDDILASATKTCDDIMLQMIDDGICTKQTHTQLKKFMRTKQLRDMAIGETCVSKLVTRFCQSNMTAAVDAHERNAINEVNATIHACRVAVNNMLKLLYADVVNIITTITHMYTFDAEFINEYINTATTE